MINVAFSLFDIYTYNSSRWNFWLFRLLFFLSLQIYKNSQNPVPGNWMAQSTNNSACTSWPPQSSTQIDGKLIVTRKSNSCAWLHMKNWWFRQSPTGQLSILSQLLLLLAVSKQVRMNGPQKPNYFVTSRDTLLSQHTDVWTATTATLSTSTSLYVKALLVV